MKGRGRHSRGRGRPTHITWRDASSPSILPTVTAAANEEVTVLENTVGQFRKTRRRDIDAVDCRTTQVVKRRRISPRTLNDALSRWDPYCVTYAPDDASSEQDDHPGPETDGTGNAEDEDEEEVIIRAGLKRRTCGSSRGYMVLFLRVLDESCGLTYF